MILTFIPSLFLNLTLRTRSDIFNQKPTSCFKFRSPRNEDNGSDRRSRDRPRSPTRRSDNRARSPPRRSLERPRSPTRRSPIRRSSDRPRSPRRSPVRYGRYDRGGRRSPRRSPRRYSPRSRLRRSYDRERPEDRKEKAQSSDDEWVWLITFESRLKRH